MPKNTKQTKRKGERQMQKKVELYDDELMVVLECLKNYRHLMDTLIKMGFDTNYTDNGITSLDNAIKKMDCVYESE